MYIIVILNRKVKVDHLHSKLMKLDYAL